uniref:Uncharacterized protein n=1 Tax=Anguilla anguilla TaxID=7936 RepID=A0A0E9R7N8_ANGAN
MQDPSLSRLMADYSTVMGVRLHYVLQWRDRNI